VRGIPLGVALVAAGLYLVGLGAAPFGDPPEGFHAAIAREMAPFGAGFSEARDVFWDSPRLERVWAAGGRAFLISTVDPGRSVVRALPQASVHVIAESGGRRLYSNLADRRSDVR
jgi:hypothetical protein